MSLEFLMADRGSVSEEGEVADIATIRSHCHLIFVLVPVPESVLGKVEMFLCCCLRSLYPLSPSYGRFVWPLIHTFRRQQ